MEVKMDGVTQQKDKMSARVRKKENQEEESGREEEQKHTVARQ